MNNWIYYTSYLQIYKSKIGKNNAINDLILGLFQTAKIFFFKLCLIICFLLLISNPCILMTCTTSNYTGAHHINLKL